jgi:hypothetical protein
MAGLSNKNGAANDGIRELSHGSLMRILRLHGDCSVPVVADLTSEVIQQEIF